MLPRTQGGWECHPHCTDEKTEAPVVRLLDFGPVWLCLCSSVFCTYYFLLIFSSLSPSCVNLPGGEGLASWSWGSLRFSSPPTCSHQSLHKAGPGNQLDQVPAKSYHITQIALHKRGTHAANMGKPLEHIAWVMRGVYTVEMHRMSPTEGLFSKVRKHN